MKDIIINKNEDGSNLIALVENGKELNLAEGWQIVELNVAKNRAGEPGKTYLLFNPALSRFDTPSLETLKVIESCKKS